jgi:hypothetical protein
MKLQEFIIQEQQYNTVSDNHIISEAFKITPDFETILEILWKKCNPFLKDLLKPGWNGEFLYSGRGDRKDVIMIRKVRSDRRPKDMPEYIHEIFDELFYDRFGFNARSNAIFCTGNVKQAKHYGNVYMIFPVGKYKLVYSNNIPDLYTEIDDDAELDKYYWLDQQAGDIKDEIKEQLRVEWENQYSMGSDGGHFEYHSFDTDIEDIPEGYDFTDAKNYVEEVLEENGEGETFNEVHLDWLPDVEFEDYLDMRFDEELNARMEELEDEWLEHVRNQLSDYVDNYSDEYLIDAIKSKNEVMLNAKYYIALSYDKYYTALQSYYKEFGYSEPRNIKIKKWYKQNKGRIPRQLSLFRSSK